MKVYIQLVRPSDDTFSEPLEFFYKPTGLSGASSRKRARTDSTYSLVEVPTVIPEDTTFTDELKNIDINEVLQTLNSMCTFKLEPIYEFVNLNKTRLSFEIHTCS